MIRNRDVAPWIPGAGIRFQFLPEDHEDVRMVRERVQDGGASLYVLRLPFNIAGSEVKVLAVGFYPDELHSPSWGLTDENQKADWQDGNLIVLKTLELEGTFSAAFTKDYSTYQPTDSTRPQAEWLTGPQAEGVLGSVFAYMGPLTDKHIAEIQRNNRSARRALKRRANAEYLEQEIRAAQEAEEQRLIESTGYLDAYEEAYKDTEFMFKGNTKVSMHIPRRSKA